MVWYGTVEVYGEDDWRPKSPGPYQMRKRVYFKKTKQTVSGRQAQGHADPIDNTVRGGH